jgi:hypothetical protein
MPGYDTNSALRECCIIQVSMEACISSNVECGPCTRSSASHNTMAVRLMREGSQIPQSSILPITSRTLIGVTLPRIPSLPTYRMRSTSSCDSEHYLWLRKTGVKSLSVPSPYSNTVNSAILSVFTTADMRLLFKH